MCRSRHCSICRKATIEPEGESRLISIASDHTVAAVAVGIAQGWKMQAIRWNPEGQRSVFQAPNVITGPGGEPGLTLSDIDAVAALLNWSTCRSAASLAARTAASRLRRSRRRNDVRDARTRHGFRSARQIRPPGIEAISTVIWHPTISARSSREPAQFAGIAT